MLLKLRWFHNDFDGDHFDALSITQFLFFDEGYKLHHFAMGVYLRHVLFDCELLALKQT